MCLNIPIFLLLIHTKIVLFKEDESFFLFSAWSFRSAGTFSFSIHMMRVSIKHSGILAYFSTRLGHPTQVFFYMAVWNPILSQTCSFGFHSCEITGYFHSLYCFTFRTYSTPFEFCKRFGFMMHKKK